MTMLVYKVVGKEEGGGYLFFKLIVKLCVFGGNDGNGFGDDGNGDVGDVAGEEGGGGEGEKGEEGAAGSRQVDLNLARFNLGFI